ncbi:hypothetical protein L6164_028521 [Bauhinia variegata]|uniref:Uncharacterized protein n=1 Tax=Bauhinia variegata TaxID=167791 RepID=A0ACB9L6J4_BAUVA|nr:hypothetical protein L6164_028521 [Bauhinia variegata]
MSQFSGVGCPYHLERRVGWKIAFALNTGEVSSNGKQESLNNASSSFGSTRLGRILTASGRQLLEKLNSARKKFPMKLFLLLLGFYTANILRRSLAKQEIRMRLQSFVTMMNYWKGGVCLGIFVDAFKVGC